MCNLPLIILKKKIMNSLTSKISFIHYELQESHHKFLCIHFSKSFNRSLDQSYLHRDIKYNITFYFDCTIDHIPWGKYILTFRARKIEDSQY